MTEPTRDTRTTSHATLYEPVAGEQPFPGMDAPEYDTEPLETIPGLDGFDPTRVRLTGLRPAEWPTEAACFGKATKEHDPWHPGPEGVQGTYSTEARQTCQGCPVRLQCLALGLAMLPLDGVHGMYGGYTPIELRAIARRRGMADRVVAQHGSRSRRVAGCDCADCKRAHAEYVAGLRAEALYAETTLAGRVDPRALPVAEPTETPMPDLFTLLHDSEAS